MLILSRKTGESFTIGNQINIKILSNSGTVQVGIEAPKHIKVLRDELIKTNSQSIANIKPSPTFHGK